MPKSQLEKKHNDQTLFLAENLRVKMMLEVYNNRISNKLRMSIYQENINHSEASRTSVLLLWIHIAKCCGLIPCLLFG